MYAKNRLDALSDGIFAVAMTLLVLDVRLPEEFHPHTTGEFLRGLKELEPKFLPYVLSFYVLGMRWLSDVRLRTREELFERKYVNWWLPYLLLITCVPFSTVVVGRYGSVAPAVWLYVGHLFLLALIGRRLLSLTPGLQSGQHLDDRQMGLVILGVTSVIAIAVSLFSPRLAMWSLLLNIIAPAIIRPFRPAT